MKKGVSFIWDDAFKKLLRISKHISVSLHLGSPILGTPFFLYVRAMDHSLGSLLAQKNDEGVKQANYYLNGILIGT